MKFSRAALDLTLKDIQLIAFDFDGIFTDDKVYVDEHGKESVACSRFDSLGIARLLREIDIQNYNTRLIVISTETNAVVTVRCEKMKLQAFTGVDDKASFVTNYARTHCIDLDHSVYAGNDLNDFSAL
jgi:3-deoxy-D-manno-octulosonate 8-phosphate phosphatase KdsC-like HAD superfamily phosphatase